MAVLTTKRAVKTKAFTTIEVPGTAQAVFEGGVACWDTSTGLVAKAAASTTLVPIGTFVESKTVPAAGTVIVQLFRELNAVWMANSVAAPVIAANLGNLVYLEDDQTVRNTDNTNANSVAGRAWALDPIKGVLVEPRHTAGDRLGGLDA